ANVSGASECTTAACVRTQLGERIPLIMDGGPSPRSVASTIVGLTDSAGGWRILREGAIPSDELTALLGDYRLFSATAQGHTQSVRSPLQRLLAILAGFVLLGLVAYVLAIGARIQRQAT